MGTWTVRLSPFLPESRVGRKAATLSRLMENGFPVPPGLCIFLDAFHAATSAGSSTLHLPDGLLDEVIAAFPANPPLAVRSSAIQEDSPDASLAGIFTTRLNVNGPAAIEQALLDCWRSYLAGSGDPKTGGMPILVQPMLDAECSGVCFTVDPVRLRPDLLLVVSAWGLGAGPVSGRVPCDMARLRRVDMSIEESKIASKHTAIRLDPSGAGVLPVPVSTEHAEIACLPDAWLQRIGEFGLAIEQVLGAPQDVEWTISGGQLWILQSRPITALPAETRQAVQFPVTWDHDAEAQQTWWLERTKNHAGDPILPAEIDFMHLNTRGGQDAIYLAGGDQTRWRKAVNGRIYMAAAKSPNPPGHVRVYGAALHDLYQRLAQQDITIWEHWGPEIIQAVERLDQFNPDGANGPALADHLENAVAAATRHWTIHTISPRPSRSAALLEVYSRLTGLSPDQASVDIPFLLAGNETIQTRLIEALSDLGCLAAESPGAARAIVFREAGGLPSTPNLQAFARGYEQLIAGYGSRLCNLPVPGFPVDIPLPWREAPEFVWQLVAAYLPQGGPGPRQARLETKRAADERIENLCKTALTGGVDLAVVDEFRRTLEYARRNATFLDEHNHYIDQLSEGQYVQALLHVGRWLAAQGCLPGAFDIFWLHTDEVLAALRDPPLSLEGILNQRREEFAGWQVMIPPARLGVPHSGMPARPKNSLRIENRGDSLAGNLHNSLQGEPACRGTAAGPARILPGDAPPSGIAPRDVLVASSANHLLIPFLPAAAALVLDNGNPGDHFAITAREFGLPSVCATLHATRTIPEGAWVTVDANTGLVTWE